MNTIEGKRFLVTTEDNFVAPDGRLYRSVWGTVKILTDDVLGIETNKNSSNWFLWVGDEDHGMLVAGCRIHYSIRCDQRPETEVLDEGYGPNGDVVEFKMKYGRTYLAE